MGTEFFLADRQTDMAKLIAKSAYKRWAVQQKDIWTHSTLLAVSSERQPSRTLPVTQITRSTVHRPSSHREAKYVSSLITVFTRIWRCSNCIRGSSLHLCSADGSPDDLKKMMDLNVLGLSVCTQQALKSMKERGVDDGHIIHINRWVVGSLAVATLIMYNSLQISQIFSHKYFF